MRLTRCGQEPEPREEGVAASLRSLVGSENNGQICRVKTLQESHGSEPYSRRPAGAALWRVDSLEKSGTLEVGMHEKATARVQTRQESA